MYKLLADAKFFDGLQVSGTILVGDILQKLLAATYHLEQATTGSMILLVGLEMLSQLGDTCGQDACLYGRTAGIILAGLELLDDFLLVLG